MGKKISASATNRLLEEDVLESSQGELNKHEEGGREREEGAGQEEEDGERHLDGPHYYCGVGQCRPKWIQLFAKANFFTFLLCLNSLVEGAIVSGFTPIVLSTIEKRYRFSSTAAGMIIGVYNLTVLTAVIFLSYFGEKAHKPRWLGISLVVQGIGALIFALPEVCFGKYDVGQGAKYHLEACEANGYSYLSDCDTGNTISYCIFLIGSITIGIGASALFTLGTSFLDDIVHPKKVSIHLGLFYAMAVVGPAIGYGLGGLFLSIYVDPWESTNLEESDPGWVGGWWMCFVLAGLVSFLLAIPFLMYPRLLPDSHLVLKARQTEMAVVYRSRYGEEKKLSVLLKTFPIHLKKLFTNWTWVTLTLAISVLFFSFDGMIAFGPKYVETALKLRSSVASVSLGAVAISAGASGVLTGALILYRLKSKARRAALVSVIFNALLIPATFTFLVYCSPSVIIGINADYPGGNGNGTDLVATCNRDCNCSSTIFEPVCGTDGVTYFSPCRAGCMKQGQSQDPVLENCTCIANSFLLSNTSLSSDPEVLLNSTATSGKCDEECTLKLVGFLVGLFIFLYLIFVMKIPSIIITLRCVAEEQRTFSLGIQSTIVRMLGSVPAPLIFGAIFDSSCQYWQYECGRRGNCWVYDNEALATRAFAVSIAGVTVSLALLMSTWLLYPTGQKSRCRERSIPVDASSVSDTELVSDELSESPDGEKNGIELSEL